MSALPSSAALLAALLEGQNALREEVRELRVEVAGLRGEVHELRELRPREPDARAGDQELVRLIWTATEGRNFSGFELIDHAVHVGPEGLRTALVVAVGDLASESAPRRLGKLLERLAAIDSDEIVLRRAGRDRLGRRWRAQVAQV